ncbi:MAG: KAP family P-loop NTPase fold protein [Chthoniobacterales bacterium]
MNSVPPQDRENVLMNQDPQPSYFSADQPLTNPAEDRLGRTRLSERIANSIANWSGRESLVISLTGDWGSGKSTIKNFVKHHLGKRAFILEFNPWQWSGQDKLLEGFLWQIGSLFGKADIAKRAKKLASRWRAYASMLQVGGVIAVPVRTLATKLFPLLTLGVVLSAVFKAPVWFIAIVGLLCIAFSLSFAANITEKIATAYKDWSDTRQWSLEELRGAIESDLSKLDKPVVVFVDDVDRLTDDEMKLLVQLIKANAQFPNLVFFLLFQKSIVAAALGKITSDDGSKYLSKIVQVEFTVPAASDKELRGMLTTALDQIMTGEGIRIRWEGERWPLLFLDTIWPYFRNLRDIKRFLGVFEFYFSMHLNHGTLEVNPIDLIAVEALRMFDHDAFLAVSNAFFRSGDRMIRGIFGKEKIRDRFKADIDAIAAASREEDKERLKTLLQSLFPQSIGDRSENEWKRNFRICDEASFDKYFEVRTDPAKPTAHDIEQFVALSGNRSELVGLLRESIADGTIEDFLDLIFVAKEEVPLESMEVVAASLFDIGDDLPEPKLSMFRVDLNMQCSRIVYHRLRTEDRTRTTDLLWSAYLSTTGFILPIFNLGLEDKASRQRSEKTDFVILEEQLDRFTDLELDRIRTRARDFSLLNNRDCALVLFRWKEWSNATEVREWIAQVIEDPDRAVLLLQHLVSVSIVNGVKRIPFINGPVVEEYVDLTTLHDAILAAQDAGLTDTNRVNISLLEKAIKLKSEGKPYSDVRLQGSEF